MISSSKDKDGEMTEIATHVCNHLLKAGYTLFESRRFIDDCVCTAVHKRCNPQGFEMIKSEKGTLDNPGTAFLEIVSEEMYVMNVHVPNPNPNLQRMDDWIEKIDFEWVPKIKENNMKKILALDFVKRDIEQLIPTRALEIARTALGTDVSRKDIPRKFENDSDREKLEKNDKFMKLLTIGLFRYNFQPIINAWWQSRVKNHSNKTLVLAGDFNDNTENSTQADVDERTESVEDPYSA
jgi:hypothetical protein